MKIYEFSIILTGVSELTEDDANSIYADCDDATVGASNGIVHVHFDREAVGLEEAIRSAVADLQVAGYSVDRVETDEFAVVDRLNHELSHTG